VAAAGAAAFIPRSQRVESHADDTEALADFIGGGIPDVHRQSVPA
jgi:hypothetical protein